MSIPCQAAPRVSWTPHVSCAPFSAHGPKKARHPPSTPPSTQLAPPARTQCRAAPSRNSKPRNRPSFRQILLHLDIASADVLSTPQETYFKSQVPSTPGPRDPQHLRSAGTQGPPVPWDSQHPGTRQHLGPPNPAGHLLQIPGTQHPGDPSTPRAPGYPSTQGPATNPSDCEGWRWGNWCQAVAGAQGIQAQYIPVPRVAAPRQSQCPGYLVSGVSHAHGGWHPP